MSTLPRIPIARPDIGPLEKQYVNEALDNNWISQGPFVDRAEHKLCKLTGRKHAICTSSGTMALTVALMVAMRDGPANKYACGNLTVAMPTLIFAAVHNVVKNAGLPRIYLRADEQSWQVPDAEWIGDEVEQCDIVLAAPCYGKVEGTTTAMSFCEPGFRIEDASESFTGSLYGIPAGKMGHVSCLSFYANKIVTAGEGGACLTDEEDIAKTIRTIVNHGIVTKDYVPKMPGLNGRMTEMSAAILCAQIERLPGMLSRRRRIWEKYDRASRAAGWRIPEPAPKEVIAPWLFACIPPNNGSVSLLAKEMNIETRPVFPCGHMNDNDEDADVIEPMVDTELISRNGICLPLSSTMSDSEIDRVCELISRSNS